jgi:hypothetical protein
VIRAEDVYDVLGLPTGLRAHMAATVAVVRLIGAQGRPELAPLVHEVELAMALHDVGNAVKFDGDDSAAAAMLREPLKTLPRWRLYAQFMRERYGGDDHHATEVILTELKVRDDLVALISRKSSRRLPEILSRGVPAEMLSLYADMRVAPEGIVSLEQRYKEANARYANSERVGLGGSVGLAQLEELQHAVCDEFGSTPDVVTSSGVEAIIADCLSLLLDEAFVDA